MKSIIIIALILSISCVTFDEALNNLQLLEKQTKNYITSTKSKDSLVSLVLRYIRSGKYSGTQWTLAAGQTPSDLITYIKNLNNDESAKIIALRNYGEITVPSKEKVDFVHMFAAMNGIEEHSYDSYFAGLTGWAGDLAQLVQDIKGEKGDLNALLKIASQKLGTSGQFGEGDLIGDLDAVNLMKLRDASPDTDFATLYRQYYKSEYKNRIANFIKKTFPSLKASSTRSDFRKEVNSEYNGNIYVRILECKYGVRNGTLGCYLALTLKSDYENHQKAAIYAFADYLYDHTH